jgi:hypothetical protein
VRKSRCGLPRISITVEFMRYINDLRRAVLCSRSELFYHRKNIRKADKNVKKERKITSLMLTTKYLLKIIKYFLVFDAFGTDDPAPPSLFKIVYGNATSLLTPKTSTINTVPAGLCHNRRQ